MDAPLINITPMSAMEARECINAIKSNLESLRLMLLELHRRRGWETLGYTSWEGCAKAEFGKSRAYTFRLLAAAQVEENLASAVESTIVDLDNIPVSHLTELSKLPPEQQPEALLKAEQIALSLGKKRNATHIAQAVQEINQPLLEAVEDAAMQEPSSEPNSLPDTGLDPEPSGDVQSISIQQVSSLLQAMPGALLRQIAHQASVSDALDNQPDTELKQMLKNALQIIKSVKQKLNQRYHSKYK